MEQYFKFKFRNYQSDILLSLDKYLEDRKVHIVAPPGSGKTILGLEIICRLNLKTIIFCPTNSIKNQWINSYQSSFNSNLKINDDIIVITYQSLYDKNITDILNWIKNDEVTLVFDEAHHLYQTWLNKINNLKQKLNLGFTLSLTATPPYDLNDLDYNKYITLCGDIDIVIEVDKLVKEHAICPHQDYIYFNDLLPEEKDYINVFKNKVSEAINEVEKSGLLVFLYNHIYNNVKNKTEESYKYANFYCSIIYYLNQLGYKFNVVVLRTYLNYFKIKKPTINDVENTYYYLTFILKNDDIKTILKKYNLLEKDRINLYLTEEIEKKINNSLNKIESISDIIKFELNLRRDNASVLILTDYIKLDELNNLYTNKAFNSLSVISIFNSLYKQYNNVAVLSGGVCIINKKHLINFNNYNYKLLNEYIVIEDVDSNLVSKVSELYNNGLINILIGTKSLLGEGWDSKITNVLIFASYIESYVSSNQMRGRALRYLDGKISHIWHLSSVPFTLNVLDDEFEVKRRFRTFYGLSYESSELNDSIARYSYFPKEISAENINEINHKTLEYAVDLENIYRSWQNISNNNLSIRKKTKINKSILSNNKIYLTISTTSIIATILIYVFNNLLKRINNIVSDLLMIIIFLIVFVVIFYLVKMLVYISRPTNYLDKLLLSLKDCLIIENKIEDVDYEIEKNVFKDNISYEISIKSKYIRDKNIFNNAVREMLCSIDNPRYVLVYYFMFIPIYTNSLVCPSIISKNKAVATTFSKKLNKYGKYKLIYTRNAKGLKILNKVKKYKTFKITKDI